MPVTASPINVKCDLNHIPVTFQLDSGASVSTLSQCDASKIKANIRPTTRQVHAYNGVPINVLGEANVLVTHNNVTFTHNFFVVVGNKVNLLGRDLCDRLKIQFVVPDLVHSIDDSLLEFKEYLSDAFMSNVSTPVKLEVSKDATPIFSKPRSVPVKLMDNLKDNLDKMCQNGTLEQVFHSRWASPIVTVFKQDGSIRICGDYSATVNKYLNPVQTPLPTVEDTVARIGSAAVFSKIDMSNAFLQIPLDETSKEFTVINTPFGLYQYNYLPFGLTASPGIFQSFITKTLAHIPNLIIYQDDVLIMSKDHSSHVCTLRQVLSTLRNTGVKINGKKCPNPIKIKSIIDAPAPKNIKQVQAFLGLCNYYSRFIPNFAQEMAPLYFLLKQNSPFQWSCSQQKCFDNVKKLFKSHNILQHYNPAHELKLETDSSSYGLGAVLLSRSDSSSPWLPIQFASRTLNQAEQNYSNIEREALSVIFGVERFRHYLLGSKFVIANDQRPLMKLFARDKPVPVNCSARIQRWALKLSQYNYTFLYSPGKENAQSDFLSRMPLPVTVEEVEPYEIVCSLECLETNNVTCKNIQAHTDSDPDLVTLKSYIKNGFPHKISNPNLLQFKSIIPDLTICKNCIMFRNRVFIPLSLRARVLDMFHANHIGIVAMKSLARSLIWFPGLDSAINSLVLNCNICQSLRSKPAKANVTWPEPSRPWSRVHIDHFFFENHVFLLVMDALTKYLEVEIVKSTSTNETIDVLSMIFARNGLPDTLVSDNATSFSSYEFSEFLSRNSVKHITPAPYSPSSNGQAERGVRTVKDLLKKSSSKKSMKYRLAQVLFQYRCTPHSLTNVVPSVALNNRKYVSLRDRINPQFCPNLKTNVCETVKLPHFEIGSSVLAANMREGQRWLSATVIEKVAINVYNVLVHEFDVVWKRHANQLLSIPEPSSNLQHNTISEPPLKRIMCRRRQPPNRLTYS